MLLNVVFIINIELTILMPYSSIITHFLYIFIKGQNLDIVPYGLFFKFQF